MHCTLEAILLLRVRLLKSCRLINSLLLSPPRVTHLYIQKQLATHFLHLSLTHTCTVHCFVKWYLHLHAKYIDIYNYIYIYMYNLYGKWMCSNILTMFWVIGSGGMYSYGAKACVPSLVTQGWCITSSNLILLEGSGWRNWRMRSCAPTQTNTTHWMSFPNHQP